MDRDSHNGFITIFLLVVFTLAVAAGISYMAYIFSKPKPQALVVVQSTTTDPLSYQYKNATPIGNTTSTIALANATSSDLYSDAAMHPLSVCGIKVLVEDGDGVTITSGVASGLRWAEMVVGAPAPKEDLDISCQQKVKNPVTSDDKLSNNISYILLGRTTGAAKVSINSYPVFDAATRVIIPALYLVKNTGGRPGSETLGFASDEWLYTFSFLHPAQDKNQDTFTLSIVPPVTPVPPPAATSTVVVAATSTATSSVSH